IFWTAGILMLLIFVGLAGGFHRSGEVALALAVFVAFLLRNLYMIHFELFWRGATPGKRLMGIPVIDRRGGALEPGAVDARQPAREIEFFLPLGLLTTGAAGGAPLAALSLGAWFLLFSLLPLFNRQRLRVGDLIAGTMVVALPKRLLLDDLAAHQA